MTVCDAQQECIGERGTVEGTSIISDHYHITLHEDINLVRQKNIPI